MFDKRLSIMSEYKINILLDRKGWKTDLKLIGAYLQKLANSLKSLEVEG
jgi:replication initiation and membrane attachment protein DnaB